MQVIWDDARSEEPQRAPSTSGPASFWTVIAVTGLAIGLIGWADVALLWWPLGFGSPAWEFGVISATFDALPLATVGLALVVIGALATGRRRVARVLAVLCAIGALKLIAIFGIYLLDIPMALEAAGELGHSAMLRSIAKTSIFALIYICLYSWLAWYVWRATRPAAARARS